MAIPTAEIIVHTVVMLSTKAGISDEELEEAASRSSSEVGLVRAELCGAREYFSRAPFLFRGGGSGGGRYAGPLQPAAEPRCDREDQLPLPISKTACHVEAKHVPSQRESCAQRAAKSL